MKGDESAFPTIGGKIYEHDMVRGFAGSPGLSKRELLAGMALQGLLTNPTEEQLETPGDECHAIIAKHAVKCADALLRELA